MSLLIKNGVNKLVVDDIFPYVQKDEQEKTSLLQCSDLYHPKVSLKSASLLSVVSIDIDGNNLSTSAILSSGGMVYASLNALYVVQNSNGWWQSSKEQQTAIHKFTFNEAGTDYSASGSVNGNVNNTFSLSEYNNNLRVATSETIWPKENDSISTPLIAPPAPIRHNNLFILEESASSSLDIIGSYEKFAMDETIFSSRFIDDKGFVVTFRRVDPLFAFDLSDPKNPVLKSELKIPGFSTYMHPIDENHLLTIGRAATEQGRVEETQLQIFDISDMSDIKKTYDHIPELLKNNEGYGYSIAEHDHHAFTYSNENNILAIPLSYYNWQANDSFSGIATFKIDVENGISENGAVDHANFIDSNTCSIEKPPVTDLKCIENQYYWYARPNRCIIMIDESGENNYLYSVSRLGIKANDLLNMDEEIGSLAISSAE